jgi:hypothetical protein
MSVGAKPRMTRMRMHAALVFGVSLAASFENVALADKVALLPPTGGDSATADAKLGQDVADGLTGLGHTLIPAADVAAALKDPAFSQRTPDALLALGKKLGADWVVNATEAAAVTTERVEIGASYATAGRFQLVGREVDKDSTAPEIKEMLAFLLRAEGVGTEAPPWETSSPGSSPHGSSQVKPPPPPPENPVKVTPPKKEEPKKPETPKAPYGGGHVGFIAAGLGVDGLVVRPKTARGSAAGFVGLIRGGAEILDTGLEPYAQLGGNMAGPSAVWVEAGIRWMGLPILHEKDGIGLHLGPSVHGGVFIVPGHTTTAPDGTSYSSSAQATGTIAGSVDVGLRVADRVQIDAQLGEVRFAPVSAGSTVSVGANFTGGYRF